MNVLDAEALLRNHPGLKAQPIHDELYELTFESKSGRQVALNRRATKTALRFWIEQSIEPSTLGLSSSAKVEYYPCVRPRAHLSAARLTGPYRGRKGNAAWYVSLTSSSDLTRLLDAYAAKP